MEKTANLNHLNDMDKRQGDTLTRAEIAAVGVPSLGPFVVLIWDKGFGKWTSWSGWSNDFFDAIERSGYARYMRPYNRVLLAHTPMPFNDEAVYTVLNVWEPEGVAQ